VYFLGVGLGLKAMTLSYPSDIVDREDEANSSAGKDPYYSRAVGKALEILRILEASPLSPLTLSELTASIGLTKTSVFRLLHTLEVLEYVKRDEQSRYLCQRPAPPLPTGPSLAQRIVQAATAPLRNLSREFRETISLAMLVSNHIEVLAVLDSPHLIRMSNVVGRILPPHASSMGKAITAYQDTETRARLISSYGMTRFTAHTIEDEMQLEQCFESVRATGISYDDEENTPGGFCMGVPIFWPGDTVQCALSLSMPKARLPVDTEERECFPRAMQAAARQIAKRLG